MIARVGVEIVVSENFFSVDKDPVSIKAGEQGTIEKLHENGRALIRFKDRFNNILVSDNDFEKLARVIPITAEIITKQGGDRVISTAKIQVDRQADIKRGEHGRHTVLFFISVRGTKRSAKAIFPCSDRSRAVRG